MGNNLCCKTPLPEPRTVTFLQNNIPDDNKYTLLQSQSIRFSEVSCRKSEKNIYIFSMSIVNQIDIHAEIPVLSELGDCFRAENYELKFGSRAIFDIFNKKYTGTFLEAKNQKTSIAYCAKIVPFKSYTSKDFKKVFYELWLNQKLLTKNPGIVRLTDYFIYGMIPDMQAFVMLFEKCSTSLANVSEYRKQSGVKWNEKEKLKVLHEIMEAYNIIYEKNIVHRDLRPSNVFYCQSNNRFCIGNFSNARILRRQQVQNEEQNDLMSVCGVPLFSCPEVKSLANKEQSIGFYEGLKQDYAGLRSIINIIETCEINDQNPKFESQQLQTISNMLGSNHPYPQILETLNQFIGKKSVDLISQIGDQAIANSCSYLLAHTYKSEIQKFTFDTYGLLGYNKQFSNKAHEILELNNENDNQLQNAPILKRLGEFYENKGTSGIQYFYNAFSLFLKRAQKEIKFGYPGKAEQQLDEAKEVYLKFNHSLESEMPRIELNRISALIQLEKGNEEEAIGIIESTFHKAAKQNLPIEKQCLILLAYGNIFRSKPDRREEALKKLVTGLAICENSAAFESPASCRIYKSNFMYIIGSLYMDNILSLHDPQKHRNQQPYGVELKSKVQTHIKSSLQIRQRQIVDDMDIAQCLLELGYFYYNDESFFDAKKYYERALIRLNQLTGKVNPMKQVRACYMKGSCSYYLDQYESAHRDYENCLLILQRVPQNKAKQLLTYNIEGNLGLAKIKLGVKEGKQLLESSMEKIKQTEGYYSYDYACLRANYYKIEKAG